MFKLKNATSDSYPLNPHTRYTPSLPANKHFPRHQKPISRTTDTQHLRMKPPLSPTNLPQHQLQSSPVRQLAPASSPRTRLRFLPPIAPRLGFYFPPPLPSPTLTRRTPGLILGAGIFGGRLPRARSGETRAWPRGAHPRKSRLFRARGECGTRPMAGRQA